MSKYMTYALVQQILPLGEVEAPNHEAAAAKARQQGDAQGIDYVEVVVAEEVDTSDG